MDTIDGGYARIFLQKEGSVFILPLGITFEAEPA
jgi:hypothetical protein